MVERKSNLRGEHWDMFRSAAYTHNASTSKASTLSPVIWGGGEKEKFLQSIQTAWTTSCTLLLLKGKEIVFSRVEETRK